MAEGRLAFDVSADAGARVMLHHMRRCRRCARLIKDYAMICESYHDAIRNAPPSQIEAIDMGRRGLHNEAAEVLQEALAEQLQASTSKPRGACSRWSARCTCGAEPCRSASCRRSVLFACTHNAIRSPMAARTDAAAVRPACAGR